MAALFSLTGYEQVSMRSTSDGKSHPQPRSRRLAATDGWLGSLMLANRK